MLKYSVITPVYNRPDEVRELLESLTKQTYKNFEVIIVEDGSTRSCEDVCRSFENHLDLKYFYKPNSGQGFSRNYGFERASGDYFVQLDSDAIIPERYFAIVDHELSTHWLDAYGGPDAAHESFTDTQKAINYAMTSVFTTGGIRGKKNNAGGQFHPRSFNFGISRKVWEVTKGYTMTRMAEDIEFSIRIIDKGFKVGLIEEAFIYHKRRTDFRQFYKQLHFFGRGRINLSRMLPSELKLVHFFPMLFTLACLSVPVQYLLSFVSPFFHGTLMLSLIITALYILLIFIDSTIRNKSLKVGFLSIIACFIQLFAYGIGFMQEKFKSV
ncbi:glycosyltransferase family 2 protein [Emticicia sp. BO119]|uniref:glycosyltransferase n=1 Tax=Emticicia sp. BO119 TaxID=2757768 RepID=UPI0015F09C81|nr:glycosyltransferase [Emticicia sp. BO119]MBA4852161.1 glycosyltransferase [Emticicia sp. BO119]